MTRFCAVVATMALLATPVMARAQAQDDKTAVDRPLATRQELESALQRAGATQVAARIKTRLSDGDFRRGDRIALEVQGEEALTDTFVVGSGAELLLPPPTVGSLSLKGVLRSELQPKMTGSVSQFRNHAMGGA